MGRDSCGEGGRASIDVDGEVCIGWGGHKGSVSRSVDRKGDPGTMAK